MGNNSPLVSIVTCTYNRAHLIAETIRSVLTQTWQDFEYIIVDDGSTDNTAEAVAAFKDKRIKYYIHERTGGHLSRLRNFAHLHCLGDYIAYIDSDDLWEPDKLAAQLVGMRDERVGFSFTDITTFNSDGIIRKTIYHKPESDYTGSVFQDMLQNKLIICHTTLVVKRSCFEKTGPMDEQMHSGDHDLVFFLSWYFDAYVIYRPLVMVRKHDQNTTSNQALNARLLKEHHRTLDKLLRAGLITEQEHADAISITSYSFGHQMLHSGDYDQARSYFMTSLRRRPGHVKSALGYLYSSAKKIFR
jgi:teichuronic acid biosynthesis glycosyltransferase TuaG